MPIAGALVLVLALLATSVVGVALGAFTEAPPGPDGTTVEEVLRERLGDVGIPVVSGVPAGHVDDNAELPFGASATVDADAGRFDLHEPATAR